jgi:hypothetical protein
MNNADVRPKIYVTPCAGRIANHPDTGEEVPAIGVLVEDSSYWRRLARGKDVTISNKAPTVPTRKTGKGA